MNHLIPKASEQMGTSVKFPLKPSEGAMFHPTDMGVTGSTASGPSTQSGSSTLRTTTSSFTGPSSLDDTKPCASVSWGSSTPNAVRQQYVAVLPGVMPLSSHSGGIPPNSVAVTDLSPLWCQYQTTSTGGHFTPVYCSLTPGRTTSQLGINHDEGAGGRMQQENGTVANKGNAETFASSTDTSATERFLSQRSDPAGSRRRSSLLLNDMPLQVQSLPQEVQALIQEAGEKPQELSTPLPDWFDAESGCIRRECLPALPNFRSTLNSSVAKLSVASRAYHRTRWPGEPAKACSSGYQQSKDRGVRRISCPDAALLPRRTDPVSRISRPPANPQAWVGGHGQEENCVAFEAAEGIAARNRRVRFATVASAQEYTERSPSPAPEACGSSGPSLCAAALPHTSREVAKGADVTQMLQGQKAAQARASDVIRCMIEMIERLMNSPLLQKEGDSTEGLKTGLKLLRAFETECPGRLPALCFLADMLETCQQLVEGTLPEEERKPLLELIEATKEPLLSRDAIIRLHRFRQELRYSKDIQLLATPLDVLQRVRICNRRKAVTGLSLYAATIDEALLDSEQKKLSNVFLVGEASCGVVSSRPWSGGKNPRAFAVDILRRCEQVIVAAKQRCTEDEGVTSPSQGAQSTNSTSLVGIVEAALKETKEFGMCSMGLLSLDNAGEKLRLATCGFIRLLVLRRSPASGILCRVAEAPVRNAAAAAETQIFRWPSKKELQREFNQHQQPGASGGMIELKCSMDPGARRQGLLRVVEWADNGDGWSSRGLVEQEVAVQEGDLFVIADDILFDVISSDEMRHLFSCCLSPLEGKDVREASTCIAPSCLSNLLKRLWRQRASNLQALLLRIEQRHQRYAFQTLGRHAVAETVEACPLDISIAAGWICKQSSDDTGAAC